MDLLDLVLLSSLLFHNNAMDQVCILILFLMVFGFKYMWKKFSKEFWVYPRSNHDWKVTHKVVWQATMKMCDVNYMAKYHMTFCAIYVLFDLLRPYVQAKIGGKTM